VLPPRSSSVITLYWKQQKSIFRTNEIEEKDQQLQKDRSGFTHRASAPSEPLIRL
jgi:hypothetical protein